MGRVLFLLGSVLSSPVFASDANELAAKNLEAGFYALVAAVPTVLLALWWKRRKKAKLERQQDVSTDA